MAKWKMHRDDSGVPDSWEITNPTRLDISAANDAAAKRRGESKVIVKGRRKDPSPSWYIAHGLDINKDDEVRSYNFGYKAVEDALRLHFPPGSDVEDIINYLSLEENGWETIHTIWWEY